MTAKKGSLWKTSWNRARGSAPQGTVDMAFFRNFRLDALNSAFYETAVPATIGAALPFWFGIVGVRSVAGDQHVTAAPSIEHVIPSSETDSVAVSGFIGGAPSAFINLGLAVLGDDYVCAALVRVTQDPTGTGFTVRTRLLDQVEAIVQGDNYLTPTFPLSLAPSVLPGALHGFCGGPGLLTNAEVRQWFKDLKANLAIQPIPGKTTHLYSAAAVYPTVPSPMANLGTDATQDVSLTTVGAPTPENVLIPVRFAY